VDWCYPRRGVVSGLLRVRRQVCLKLFRLSAHEVSTQTFVMLCNSSSTLENCSVADNCVEGLDESVNVGE